MPKTRRKIQEEEERANQDKEEDLVVLTQGTFVALIDDESEDSFKIGLVLKDVTE